MKLGVNVDHIATIREARKSKNPDPILAALIAEQAGADSIVIHLRGDRRHIQERDLEILKKVVKTKLNLEMAPTLEMKRIALTYHPDMVTLVPEREEEITTEGGLDVVLNEENLRGFVQDLLQAKIEVSLFIDADLEQIKAAHKIGAPTIEINTGKYSESKGEEQVKELEKIKEAASFARRIGLKVVAGHGLDYHNVSPITEIREIEELSIGFAIVARSVFVGFEQAVKEMITLIKRF
ncbi:pyridoxine 5'-phosphate synthase [Candidatus Aminicenantes bacterium AC-708-M15]|jgi:pyridoxine 5-phosphate synthase|nr:pyridoxine 5'-phosphate synthase [SCandidatus Aminicenantes bacterium Aminicenantia_JdfR_composite]MCP2596938.1 pyridoxine 5'-phosphate synthase [Candidatus Aminicenantes bacterium AC-335-G13]MCP2603984.1 pyridoxine 5'-phosphate synthase [Candidatus Aminicenantes bacterium AC-708-M15]